MLVAFAAIALYGVLAGATPLVVRAVLMGGFSVLGDQLGCCQTGQIVLVIGSGYAPLNTPEWIERWRPQVILLSVAAGDPNGRPDLENCKRWMGTRCCAPIRTAGSS